MAAAAEIAELAFVQPLVLLVAFLRLMEFLHAARHLWKEASFLILTRSLEHAV